MTGYYYLHTNGNLIYKPASYTPEDFDSPFVRRWWTIDTTNRISAWKVILESLALGAEIGRIQLLAAHWECDNRDLVNFLVHATPTTELYQGIRIFIEKVMKKDPDTWFDWLASTPKGQEPDWSREP